MSGTSLHKNRRFFRRMPLVLTGAVLCAVLSACLEDAQDKLLEPFSGPQSHYTLEGVPEDAESLKPYLQSVIDDTLAANEIDSDTQEESVRREAYVERTIDANLEKALRAKGYYDAKVEFESAEELRSGSYNIQPGALYKISAVSVAPDSFAQFLGDTLKPGDTLDAQIVLAAQEKLHDGIQKDQCYFSLNVKHEVVLDKIAKTGAIAFIVEASEQALFGEAEFKGMETVEQEYLQKRVTWKPGDCFRHEKIESLRTALLSSGLFSRADANLPTAPNDQGRVDVVIDLKERAHKTVRAGLSYYTDEGAGVTLGWQHRNFLGQAEKLDAALKVSTLEQSLSADLTKPYFLRKDQNLSLNASIKREDTDAYDEYGITAGASLGRTFNKRLSGNLGVELTLTRIDDETGTDDTYGLVSFPAALVYDSRDDTLNPTKGWFLRGSAEPFYDVLGAGEPFFKTRFGARTYFALNENRTTVLALRTAIGSITGASTGDVPPTERFYAGGGGSVRGFGYQEIGPFENDDPAGGRGLFEGAAELRFKLSDNLGAVTFVDAGNVTQESMPKFDQLSVGVGAGLRYYTDFGPLRLDVATPVHGDENTDSNYQIYISIGQAF